MPSVEEIGTRIGEELVGTCLLDIWSLAEDLIEEGVVTQEWWNKHEIDVCLVVDNITFHCVCCGWWCEVGDYAEIDTNGEEVCSSCEDDY